MADGTLNQVSPDAIAQAKSVEPTPVENAPKTFKASENYEGKVFVKIKAVGQKEVSMMVKKGSVINAPYQLDDSLRWYSNGSEFDFTKPINETTFIYADYPSEYYVTIHFIGVAKEDEILKLTFNESISFDRYDLEGFNKLVISDEGKEISDFKVTRDAYINIVYIRK